MANRAMSAAAPAPHLAISITSHQTLALDRVVAAITPRRPSDPTATASALAAAGQVATLVDVLSHAFPLKCVDRWPDDIRCTPGLTRLLARALVEQARAADLFPLLPPEQLDEMDAQVAPGHLPSYVWSIPFSDAYRYAVYRQGGAGPLERVLYTLATAPYVGVAEASADMNVAPSGPDDPLLPLLHLLTHGHAAVARAVESLHSATAARLFTWLGDPCPSISALLTYMVGEIRWDCLALSS